MENKCLCNCVNSELDLQLYVSSNVGNVKHKTIGNKTFWYCVYCENILPLNHKKISDINENINYNLGDIFCVNIRTFNGDSIAYTAQLTIIAINYLTSKIGVKIKSQHVSGGIILSLDELNQIIEREY